MAYGTKLSGRSLPYDRHTLSSGRQERVFAVTTDVVEVVEVNGVQHDPSEPLGYGIIHLKNP